MGDALDFFTKYHNISNKLKKRFLRKPNVAEASDQFGILAAECREFLVANKKEKDIGCPPVGQENTQAAISCFGHALARCQNQTGFSTMSAGLALELAIALGPTPAGIQQLYKAIGIFPTVKAISTLVSYHIKQGDYVSALQIINELVEFIEIYINTGAKGNYSVILHRCEVTRVLLLLILQPSPQRLAPSLAQVLEKYAWIEESSNVDFNMSEDELLLLQSLVLASQSHDYQALLELEGELWPYLDAEQRELLHKLIQVLTTQ
ncbi:40-kDa huntingtin-associated protein isoform X3 [Megalopta genalis]|uniref:40-kDa huntingtin-associated protein isoform X3 n=1 Tax=Megalopta genalis TaxID=115081 RepID=UPI0014437DD3|nr:40-kDa huntingtin-associated protein-like isoform X3 [Megalopta genalis]